MDELREKQSLWQEMLENILIAKKEPSGNIMIFGDPTCGKKKVIEVMNDMIGSPRTRDEF